MLGTTFLPHCSAAERAMSVSLERRFASRSPESFVTDLSAGTRRMAEMPVSTAFSTIHSIFSGATRLCTRVMKTGDSLAFSVTASISTHAASAEKQIGPDQAKPEPLKTSTRSPAASRSARPAWCAALAGSVKEEPSAKASVGASTKKRGRDMTNWEKTGFGKKVPEC